MFKKLGYILFSLNLFTFLFLPTQGHQTICLRRTRQVAEGINKIAEYLGYDAGEVLGLYDLTDEEAVLTREETQRVFFEAIREYEITDKIRQNLSSSFSEFSGRVYVVVVPGSGYYENIQADIVYAEDLLLIQIPEPASHFTDFDKPKVVSDIMGKTNKAINRAFEEWDRIMRHTQDVTMEELEDITRRLGGTVITVRDMRGIGATGWLVYLEPVLGAVVASQIIDEVVILELDCQTVGKNAEELLDLLSETGEYSDKIVIVVAGTDKVKEINYTVPKIVIIESGAVPFSEPRDFFMRDFRIIEVGE